MKKYTFTDVQWFSRDNGTQVPFLFNKSYDKIKLVLEDTVYDLDKAFQDFGNKSTKISKEQADVLQNSLQNVLGKGTFDADNAEHLYKIYAEEYDNKYVDSKEGVESFKQTMESHGMVSKRFIKDIADEATRLNKKHLKKIEKLRKKLDKQAEKMSKM